MFHKKPNVLELNYFSLSTPQETMSQIWQNDLGFPIF